jgi:hypothetical protein
MALFFFFLLLGGWVLLYAEKDELVPACLMIHMVHGHDRRRCFASCFLTPLVRETGELESGLK